MSFTLIGVLDNVRSRYNVGAIFRTADGLGAGKLYLCGITPRPDRIEDRLGIAKTALGAEATVPWEGVGETADLIRRLKSEGYTILALETGVGAVSLDQIQPGTLAKWSAAGGTSSEVKEAGSNQMKLALIIGHELHGIHADVLAAADQVVEIPMHGTKRSLNVEVAFAIAAYTLLASRHDA